MMEQFERGPCILVDLLTPLTIINILVIIPPVVLCAQDLVNRVHSSGLGGQVL